MRYILGIVDPLSDRKHGLFVMSGCREWHRLDPEANTAGVASEH